MREGAEVMHQAWLPVEGDVGPVSRVFQAREQMSNGVVLGTVSGSVFLGHKGMKRPGERLTGEMGKGPIKKSLGCHGKELGLHPSGQWFSTLAAHQLSRKSQKEIWMPHPILSIKSESLGVGSWELTLFFLPCPGDSNMQIVWRTCQENLKGFKLEIDVVLEKWPWELDLYEKVGREPAGNCCSEQVRAEENPCICVCAVMANSLRAHGL